MGYDFIKKLPNILVVSNDAGATEYIAYMILKEQTKAKWDILARENSPASKIFTRLELKFSFITFKEDIINTVLSNKPDIILYGTGWQIDFSTEIKKICKLYNIKSVAVIDHWTKYKERFATDAAPGNIIVMDDYAFNLAQNTFESKINILQIKNYFFEYVRESFNKVQFKPFNCILFISEPTEKLAIKKFGDKNGFGFTEYTVMSEIIKTFNDIIIRLHPSDNENKYDDMISHYPNKNIRIVKPYEEELVETLSKSKLTIGFDGMALFLSHILGIKTISYMPNSSRELNIPMSNIYKVDSLKNINKINFTTQNTQDLDLNSILFDEGIECIH